MDSGQPLCGFRNDERRLPALPCRGLYAPAADEERAVKTVEAAVIGVGWITNCDCRRS
jgi:hypothetical protein